MCDKKFTIYMHIAPNDKRYIGITSSLPIYRWGRGGKRYQHNEYFWRAIQKYGWENFEHIILFENLNYEIACKIEKNLISKYNTTNENFGYNHSIGGELSALGCKRSLEQRQHYSNSKKGNKNPQFNKPAWNKGVPCREETKEKLRLANKGNPSPNKNTHLSEERKQYLHNINVGKIYVTNDKLNITKCISKSELDDYLSLGYYRGYSKNRSGRWKKKSQGE